MMCWLLAVVAKAVAALKSVLLVLSLEWPHATATAALLLLSSAVCNQCPCSFFLQGLLVTSFIVVIDVCVLRHRPCHIHRRLPYNGSL